MAFKLVLLFAVVSCASAGVIQDYGSYYHQPQATIIKQVQPAYIKHVEHEAPANYEFNYDVHDPHTGDIKQQHEVAKDGHIKGQYSLIEPDGLHRRIVSYEADEHHGFQADVQREAIGHKVIAQPTITKVIQPAIAVKKVYAPVQTYSAPSYSGHQYSHGSYYH